jgi:ribokinase
VAAEEAAAGRGVLFVVGSLNEDLVVPVSHVPRPGETLLGGPQRLGCGGKGANQAVAAARAGAAVHMIGCVGSDAAGARLVAGLASEHIDTSAISIEQGPTGTAVVLVDPDGENAIVVMEGANGLFTPERVRSALADLSPRDVVVAQGETPLPAIEAAAQMARSAGARFLLNLAPPREIEPRRTPVSVLVVNQHEAQELARRAGCHSDDLDEVARHLSAAWDAQVFVTLGGAGAMDAKPEGVQRYASIQADRVVDTTGAGDAFVGAVAAALVAGESTQTALRWGLAAGAITVASEGAQGGRISPDAIAAMIS